MFYPPSIKISQKSRNVKSVIFRFLFLSIFASFVFSSCQKESLSDGLLLENEVEQSGILAKKGQNDEKRASPTGCQCTYRVLSQTSNGGTYSIEVNESGVQPITFGDEFSIISGGSTSWFSSDVSLNSSGYPTFDTELFFPRPSQSIYTLQSHTLDVAFNASGNWTADLEIYCEGTLYNGGVISNTFTQTITRPAGLNPGEFWKVIILIILKVLTKKNAIFLHYLFFSFSKHSYTRSAI